MSKLDFWTSEIDHLGAPMDPITVVEFEYDRTLVHGELTLEKLELAVNRLTQ